jgi:hypothetical protein
MRIVVDRQMRDQSAPGIAGTNRRLAAYNTCDRQLHQHTRNITEKCAFRDLSGNSAAGEIESA